MLDVLTFLLYLLSKPVSPDTFEKCDKYSAKFPIIRFGGVL